MTVGEAPGNKGAEEGSFADVLNALPAQWRPAANRAWLYMKAVRWVIGTLVPAGFVAWLAKQLGNLNLLQAVELALGLFVLLAGMWWVARVLVPRSAGSANRALRGIRPLQSGDPLFGRGEDLDELLQLVSQPEFRIGVLKGPATCGKTSLVQAGLLPQLTPGPGWRKNARPTLCHCSRPTRL